MKKWKSFSDWRLRTKLFFILALCLVVSMLLSVYNMFHISRAYDRELYGALSNFLSLSVTEIGYKLDNVQQMTTDTDIPVPQQRRIPRVFQRIQRTVLSGAGLL